MGEKCEVCGQLVAELRYLTVNCGWDLSELAPFRQRAGAVSYALRYCPGCRGAFVALLRQFIGGSGCLSVPGVDNDTGLCYEEAHDE